jgi:hypothetical protein
LSRILRLTEEEKDILKKIGASEENPIAQRATIILKMSDGIATTKIGEEMGISAWGVGYWRKKWLDYRFAGTNLELEIRKFLESSKGGRPKKCKEPQIEKIIESRSKHEHNSRVAQEARMRGLPKLSPRSIGRILENHKEELTSNI